MYAGMYLPHHSASWLGTHQKLNKAAFRAVGELLNENLDRFETKKIWSTFPNLKLIQHFEGKNGPDGLKVKSPGQAEPWHFYQPFNPADIEIFGYMSEHFKGLVQSLGDADQEKAAFEASWLAHVITDGLTPAHHYPYEHELSEIRGDDRKSRTSKTKKVLARGSTLGDTFKKNWRFLGARGLFTTHLIFELGVAGAVITHRIVGGRPSEVELAFARDNGLSKTFTLFAEQIAKLNLYGRFYDRGWSPRLARKVRYQLAPIIVKTITVAWLLAIEQSGVGVKKP